VPAVPRPWVDGEQHLLQVAPEYVEHYILVDLVLGQYVVGAVERFVQPVEVWRREVAVPGGELVVEGARQRADLLQFSGAM